MLPTQIYLTFWKHLHILCYYLGISNHRRLCWIWCIWRKIAQMHLFISNFSWKYEIGTMVIFLFIDVSRDGNFVACATVFLSNTAIFMRLPDSASIFTAEIWTVIKILLHPITLVLHKHFRVSKIYNVYSWDIPWLGWWYESVLFIILPVKKFFVGYPAILALGVTKG